MDRTEAERIYEQGREAVIEALMTMAARIAELEARIARLEQMLAKNSSNSDKPPSTDGPFVQKKRKKIPGLRRQGGQPGHQGKNRELLPEKEMDEIHHLYPDACRHCRHSF